MVRRNPNAKPHGRKLGTDSRVLPVRQKSSNQNNQCYFNIDKEPTADYPGIHESQTIEMAFWQGLVDNPDLKSFFEEHDLVVGCGSTGQT